MTLAAGMVGLPAGWADLAPYAPDAATLQLWHLDESAGATSCVNAATGGVALLAISNGATLGEASFPGFGTAASTYDGGPAATLSANPNGIPGRDAYLAPRALANGTNDNAALAFAGTNGAFTFEALVRADFPPDGLAVAPDTARDMQILSADAEESASRLFQFRVYWSSTNDATPELQFINIMATNSALLQILAAPIPTGGANAIVSGQWYHVAVTYNGAANTASNLSLYWTKVETNRLQADLLFRGRMSNDLPSASSDWAIGNEGRSTGGSSGNWVGLIDEVRFSDIARLATDFVFYGDPDTDDDGLPDAWELLYFDSLAQDAGGDPDTDGYTNAQEYQAGSAPNSAASTPLDLDADGLPDAWEITYFGSLSAAPGGDADGDGASNLQEWTAGTVPVDPASNPADTDADGLADAWEQTRFGSLAQGAGGDPDGDGSGNLQEFRAGTNPNSPSSLPDGPPVRFVPIDDGNPATSEYGYAGSSGINTICFICTALTTVGDRQFAAFYGRHAWNAADTNNNRIFIARRVVGAATWEVFRTAFTANNIADGHDTVCMGFDGDGVLHMSWGMHGNPFHYARTTASVTGDAAVVFGPDSTMTGKEGTVTYPQFFTLPDGDLLYLFREGGSGNGDTYLNRYYRASQMWSNVHRSGTTQLPFIKGTGWTPNYNAYPNMPCLDAAGRMFLVWTWRYNDDSPAGEVGYQTNHDFDYGDSADGGLTWRRSDGTAYTLPITERGEAGTNTMAERILAIPEGSSLINQAGLCLDEQGKPVLAAWWAPGAATNDHRRQYLVAFPSTNGWQTRQISWRTIDSPAVKKPESEVRDLGRPVVVCDPVGRIVVLYRDNDGSNGLTIVHSLPRAADPDRRVWTSVELAADNLGVYEPVIDLARWQRDQSLQILYQPSAGQGYTPPANTASRIGVLEWNAAAYFAHVPDLRLARTNAAHDAVISCRAQTGWDYRLWAGPGFGAWHVVSTNMGAGGKLEFMDPGAGADQTYSWWIEAKEGGFSP